MAECPETNYGYADRVLEQMKYFNCPQEKVITAGKTAGILTKNLLSKPFTAITKGEDARGNSHMQRIYAYIKTSDGKDLGEILISYGLARSYGKEADAPKVRNDLRGKYDLEEKRAQRGDIGTWGQKDIKVSTTDLKTLSSGDVSKAQREAKEVDKKEGKKLRDLISTAISAYSAANTPNTPNTPNSSKNSNTYGSSNNKGFTKEANLQTNSTAISPPKEEIRQKEDSIFNYSSDDQVKNTQTPNRTTQPSSMEKPTNSTKSPGSITISNQVSSNPEEDNYFMVYPTIEIAAPDINPTALN
jgi:hypothetical protein